MIPQTIQEYWQYVLNFQAQSPDGVECFARVYVCEGLEKGWKLISAKSGRYYTPKEYFKEFGVKPELPDENIVFSSEYLSKKEKLNIILQKKNPLRGKGFKKS